MKIPFIKVPDWFRRFIALLDYVLIGYIFVMSMYHIVLSIYSILNGYEDIAFAHLFGAVIQTSILLVILMFRSRDKFEKRLMTHNIELMDLINKTAKILQEQDDILQKLDAENTSLKQAKASLEGKLKQYQTTPAEEGIAAAKEDARRGRGRPKKLTVNQ